MQKLKRSKVFFYAILTNLINDISAIITKINATFLTFAQLFFLTTNLTTHEIKIMDKVYKPIP